MFAGHPPGSESQRTGSGTGRGGRVFHDGRPPVCHEPHAGGYPPPSSPQELPLIHHEVLNEFCPGEQLDSEPLSRNGSLVDNTFEESEFWKTPKGDPYRLSSTTAHEFPMRLAVKGEACVLALSVNPVNSGRVGWGNSLSDDPVKGHSPHSPSPSAEAATVAGGSGAGESPPPPPRPPAPW